MSFKKISAIMLLIIVVIWTSFALASEAEDLAITADVKLKLAAEKDIPIQKIEVETNNKVVSLRGTLDTNLQVHRAIELAASIDKVDDVISDELNVKGSKSLIADSVITAKVKGKIRHLSIYKKIAENYDLHVETTDGIVHIFGKVSNPEDINVITSAAKEIKGVKSVKINIK